MHPVIAEIYETRVVRDASGNEYPAHSNIDRAEGEFLSRLIADDAEIRKTLEVGCAYGLSSLHICSALAGRESPRHVILDPFQHSSWQGVGVANLERAGCDFYELVEAPSELALPELVRDQAGSFDLVFIDGWHTFDHTMLDLFYANRLLRTGGYVVIDDCNMPPVAKAVQYVASYPAYRLWAQLERRFESLSWKGKLASLARPLFLEPLPGILPRFLHDRLYYRMRFSTMVALKKIDEDRRDYHWFKSF